ncbi:MAG: hypothetical protein AB7F40_04260 [Victivallaceae bacterium]
MIEQETANLAVSGMTVYQLASVLLIGGGIAVGLIALMIWLIRLNNRPFEKIPEKIDELVAQLLRLEGRLWSREEIDQAISVKITEHNENENAHSVQKVRKRP